MGGIQNILLPGLNPNTTTGFAPQRSGVLDHGSRLGRLHELLTNMRRGLPGSEESFLEGLRECHRQRDQRALFEEYAKAFRDEIAARRAVLDGHLAELARIK